MKLNYHKQRFENGKTVIETRPLPFSYELDGKKYETNDLLRDTKDIEKKYETNEETLKEDIYNKATKNEKAKLDLASQIKGVEKLKAEVIIDDEVNVEVSGLNETIKSGLKNAGVKTPKHFVWIDGAEKKTGAIILSGVNYSDVFVVKGTKDKPEITKLTGKETERPYYEEKDGKTYIYVDGFSGGGTSGTWNIPTDADFKYLEGYVDSTYGVGNAEWDGISFRGDDAGDNLKDPSVSNWLNATQGWDTGWDGLPGGLRDTDGELYSVGSYGYWWSSSVDGGNAWFRYLRSSHSGVHRYSDSQALGFSVRCFRDTTTAEDSDDDGTIYTDDYEGNDGTKYDSIKIGDQVWITENLSETKWYDGTTINEETTTSGWDDAGDNSEPALMGSTSGHPSTYGYLYNWFAVDSSDDMINYDYSASTAETSTHTVDTLILKEETSEHTADTSVFRRESEEHTTDTALVKGETETHTVDTALKEVKTETHTTDTILLEQKTETHTVDTLIYEQDLSEHTTDTALYQQDTSEHTVDTTVFSKESEEHTVDTTLVKEEVVNHTVDTLTDKGAETVEHTVDTILKADETLGTDLWRLTETISEHTVDTTLKTTEETEHTVDTLTQTTESVEHTIDSFLTRDEVSTHSVDTLLAGTEEIAHGVDTALVKEETETHTVDTTLKEVETETHTVDTTLWKTSVGEHAIDTFVSMGNMSFHSVDTVLLKREDTEHTVDTSIFTVGVETHTIDTSLLERGIDQHTVDTILYKEETTEHTVDTYLKEVKTTEHTVDALLRVDSVIKTHTVDTTTKKATFGSHTVDTNIKGWAYTGKNTTDDWSYSSKNASGDWTYKDKNETTTWTYSDKHVV